MLGEILNAVHAGVVSKDDVLIANYSGKLCSGHCKLRQTTESLELGKAISTTIASLNERCCDLVTIKL